MNKEVQTYKNQMLLTTCTNIDTSFNEGYI